MNGIAIALADDHTLFLEGLSRLLSDIKEFKILIKASNGLELIEKLKYKKVDVVLLDLKMPHMNGVETAKHIKTVYPQIKIIALSMFDDKALIADVAQVGMHGYLLKNAFIDEIARAIYAVNNGNTFFTSMGLEKIREATVLAQTKVELSNLEKQILRLLYLEYKTNEIADVLNLSARTIEGYRLKLLKKLEVKSTVGLVKYAMANSLVD
jgi:DNA-binding NarL/FixJ family response regulator